MNVTSLSFPYGESIQWFCSQSTNNLPPAPLKNWLLATGSLTQKLKSCCTQFEVTVLGEGELRPLPGEYPPKAAESKEKVSKETERKETGRKETGHEETVWIREVLLCLDTVPWVFARTLIPQALLFERQADFLGLGNRPLGELLFSQGLFVPGKIEVARFSHESRLAQLAASLEQPVAHVLWGRRRYFHHGAHEMLVSEVFLPAAERAIRAMAASHGCST
ncbi:MAG: chorismate--pyruvate lyase family protein [Shewanella sp.]